VSVVRTGAFLAWFRDVARDKAYDRAPIEASRDDGNPVELDVNWPVPWAQRSGPCIEATAAIA